MKKLPINLKLNILWNIQENSKCVYHLKIFLQCFFSFPTALQKKCKKRRHFFFFLQSSKRSPRSVVLVLLSRSTSNEFWSFTSSLKRQKSKKNMSGSTETVRWIPLESNPEVFLLNGVILFPEKCVTLFFLSCHMKAMTKVSRTRVWKYFYNCYYIYPW